MVQGLLEAAYISGSLLTHRLPELSIETDCVPMLTEGLEKVQAKATEFSSANSTSGLADVLPFLNSLTDVLVTLEKPGCVNDHAKFPPFLRKAIDTVLETAQFVRSGAETELVIKATKKFAAAVLRGAYSEAGKAAGEALAGLSQLASAVPLLEGLAQALLDGSTQLAGCSDAVGQGAATVAALRAALAPLPPRQWPQNDGGVAETVADLQAFLAPATVAAPWTPRADCGAAATVAALQAGPVPAELMDTMDTMLMWGASDLMIVCMALDQLDDALSICVPGQFQEDDRLKSFRTAVGNLKHYSKGGSDVLLYGLDVDDVLGNLSVALVAGDGFAAGKSLGTLIDLTAVRHSGVKAVTDFFSGLLSKPMEAERDFEVCIQSDTKFLDSCGKIFSPYNTTTTEAGAREMLQRTSSMTVAAQKVMEACQPSYLRDFTQVVAPEFAGMVLAIDKGLAKAQSDSQLVIAGLDTMDAAKAMFVAMQKNQYSEAQTQLSLVLRNVNGQVNSRSFLKGMLGKFQIGVDSFDDCIHDATSIAEHMSFAMHSLSITPQKWTIDKDDVDSAMNQFGLVVESVDRALTHCAVEIEAITTLAKVFLGRIWEYISSQVMVFNNAIGKDLWVIALAVQKRDWLGAGTAFAEFAMKVMDSYTSSGQTLGLPGAARAKT